MRLRAEKLVLMADLIGTVVFAIEGALTAMRAHLDLLGVMVIAFIVAMGGGVIRDLLIGDTPPSAIRDWRYPALTFAAGFITFIFSSAVLALPPLAYTVLDAAGLALFAVAGVQKALLHGIRPFIAVLLGTVTGTGGGVVRDVLLARVPLVLYADIYATAAFLAGALVVSLRRCGVPDTISAISGGVACFVLRLLAVHYGWHLPRATL
ncbi:trimeric intracellular cation channel family protein [Amantichitinum ursilacus]|uniref:Glycine transporter domain-containing protein n=1 Tax=Amantichitinum ursilacus TaxID=857265 RepID=A0A0N0XKZ3_9NEIS|nr:trimeric intracellular cation channel family protein [Amantichitinum ursilacus]KPC54649.1 hypothetical protein WG78_03720 [Amantichitinum ursilacus]